MTTVVHGPAHTWAAAHRALLFVLVLAAAVLATITIVLLVQAADDPATGTVAPSGTGEPACVVDDTTPMTGAFADRRRSVLPGLRGGDDDRPQARPQRERQREHEHGQAGPQVGVDPPVFSASRLAEEPTSTRTTP